MKKKRFSVEQITAVLQQVERRNPRRRRLSPGRDLRADVLSLEEGLRRDAAQRGPRAEAAARGKYQAEAPRRRPDAGQGHAPGRRSKKVLKPVKQREVMQYLMGRYDVSTRRACRRGRDDALVGVLPEPEGSADGAAAAHARAGADARALRLSTVAGAAAARRLGRSAKSASIACTPRKAWRCDANGRGDTPPPCIESSDGRPRRATTSGAWISWPTNWPMVAGFGP